MKKLLLLLFISFGLFGCSSLPVSDALTSLELNDALSSEDEAQRILALGLTHEENLIEASKLGTPHLVSVVSLKLTNARDEKIQNDINLIESEKLAELVKVSNNGLIISGSEVSESKKTGVLQTDVDLQSYYLKGTKDSSTGNISHKLHLSVVHNSKNKREYYRWIKANIPQNRIGTPDDVSNIVTFICSNYASFVNGQNIKIDGGQSNSA